MFPVRRVVYDLAYPIYCVAIKSVQFPGVLRERVPRFLSDEVVAPARGDRFAIVVKYAGFGMTGDFIDLLAALGRAGVNPIVVCNGKLKPEAMAAMRPHAHRILTRRNIGRDFGAYRAATLHLHGTGLRPSQLFYFNDSLIYLGGPPLDAMIEEMGRSDYDVVGSFENHEFTHHIGSYAFAVSGAVFSDPRVLRFWRRYRPYDLRPHAIRQGEVAYSTCLHRCGYRIDVVYSADKLASRLDAMPFTMLVANLRYVPFGAFHDYALKEILAGAESTRTLLSERLPPLKPAPRPAGTPRLSDYRPPNAPPREAVEARGEAERVADRIGREVLVGHIMGVIISSSQVHYGFGLFHRVMGSPLVKKDLLMRGVYLEHQCARILDHLSPDRRHAIMRELINRGRPTSMRGFGRFKLHHGLT